MIAKFKALVACLSFAVAALGQPRTTEVGLAGLYDPAVPSPSGFLGYPLGQHYTSHQRLLAYMQALAQSSPRVHLEVYGKTYEGRELQLLQVSAEQNLAKLEAILQDLLRLRAPSAWKGPAEISRITRTSPAIVWLSYNVHGNEPSSSEAAMEVAYQLAAGTDDRTAAILRDLIVIIDPMLNPAGRERYVNWFNSVSGRRVVTDPESREHQEPWPGGRTNHYYFDLNRDWAWLTQMESQARMRAYRRSYPHTVIDFHEMGFNSSYFFFPARGPFHAAFPPLIAEWGRIYGQGNAAAFDARGWRYYTEEDFDLFYPGYGDSWPSLNGAIGMTYEQGGHAVGGLEVKRNDGTILTLKERIAHHVAASLASLQTTQTHRQQRLEDFHRFWKEGYEAAGRDHVQTYAIVPGMDEAGAGRAMQLLLNQGIEVEQATERFVADRATPYTGGRAADVTCPAGTFLVHRQQAASRLVAALFDPQPAILDTFFYDITAWCFPVAYRLQCLALPYRPAVTTRALVEVPPPRRSPLQIAHYAYLMPWEQQDAGAALLAVMERGYRTYASTKPFTLEGREYDRGTIVIPVLDNGEADSLAVFLRRLAQRYDLVIAATDRGQSERGIDLGSRNIRYLRRPRVAVIADDPVDESSYGAVWYLFDQRLDQAFSTLSVAQLKSAPLEEYNVMVLPNTAASLASRMDSSSVKRLKHWVEEGGVLIGLQGGASVVASETFKLGTVKVKKEESDKAGEDEKDRKARQQTQTLRRSHLTLEEGEKEETRQEIPGTIMKMRLDTTHPLGFGLPDTMYVLKSAKVAFELSDRVSNVAIYAPSPRFAGFLSSRNAEWIADTAGLTSEKLGRGRIILFADDPNFRHFWPGMTRLFTNAVVFARLD